MNRTKRMKKVVGSLAGPALTGYAAATGAAVANATTNTGKSKGAGTNGSLVPTDTDAAAVASVPVSVGTLVSARPGEELGFVVHEVLARDGSGAIAEVLAAAGNAKFPAPGAEDPEAGGQSRAPDEPEHGTMVRPDRNADAAPCAANGQWQPTTSGPHAPRKGRYKNEATMQGKDNGRSVGSGTAPSSGRGMPGAAHRRPDGILEMLGPVAAWFHGWRLASLAGWIVFPAFVTLGVFVVGMTLKHNLFLAASDLQIVRDLGRFHGSLATTVALGIHDSLRGPAAVLILLGCAGLVLVLKRSASDALLVLLLATAGWLPSMVMKSLVARPRPEADLLTGVLVPGLDGSMSFPSGHTAFAVSLGIAVSLSAWGTSWRRPVVAASVLFTVLVGASRVYLGVHYPSDVIASCALSIAAVVFTAGLLARWFPRPVRHGDQSWSRH